MKSIITFTINMRKKNFNIKINYLNLIYNYILLKIILFINILNS